MVKFNPFEPRELVFVTSHPSTKKRLFLRKVPITAANPTKGQLQARTSFGEFAYVNCYGKGGSVTLPDGRRISQPAYIIMTQYSPGKMPASKDPATRRTERHAMSRANLDKLKAKLAAMA